MPCDDKPQQIDDCTFVAETMDVGPDEKVGAPTEYQPTDTSQVLATDLEVSVLGERGNATLNEISASPSLHEKQSAAVEDLETSKHLDCASAVTESSVAEADVAGALVHSSTPSVASHEMISLDIGYVQEGTANSALESEPCDPEDAMPMSVAAARVLLTPTCPMPALATVPAPAPSTPAAPISPMPAPAPSTPATLASSMPITAAPVPETPAQDPGPSLPGIPPTLTLGSIRSPFRASAPTPSPASAIPAAALFPAATPGVATPLLAAPDSDSGTSVTPTAFRAAPVAAMLAHATPMPAGAAMSLAKPHDCEQELQERVAREVERKMAEYRRSLNDYTKETISLINTDVTSMM